MPTGTSDVINPTYSKQKEGMKSEANDDDIFDSPEALLTNRMRAATKDVHDESANRTFNVQLGFVLVSRELYAEAISLFQIVYQELEDLLVLEAIRDARIQEHVMPLLPMLRRASRFQQDIEFLLDHNPKKIQRLRQARGLGKKQTSLESSDESSSLVENAASPKSTQGRNGGSLSSDLVMYDPPELQQYVERLRTVQPRIVLVAYVYHMYMAIMAGGYMIRRSVRMSLRLSSKEDRGVQGFCFDEVSHGMSRKTLQTKLKVMVNHDLHLTPSEQEAMLTESTLVFAQNNALVMSVESFPTFQQYQQRCRSWIWVATISLVVSVAIAVARFGG